MHNKPSLSLADARAIVAAAEKYAEENGFNVAIAVVDASTHVQHVARMDGAGAMTANGAIGKARSAAGSSLPTSLFAKSVSDGDLGPLKIPGIVPVAGGVPVLVDGHCCGAVGVSGVLPHLDDAIAQAGAAAITGAA